MTPGSIDLPLSGWGRFPTVRCRTFRPEMSRDLCALAGYLPRGLGRSYGDASLDGRHGVVSMTRLDRLLSFDETTGMLEAEAGVSLGDIAHTFLPRGWFLPVTPGTKFVTLGGAIAGEVHGKNHHVDGAFSSHVEAFDLLCPNGERIRCSRTENPDAFAATIGGMGLTGCITQVTLRLRRVPGPWVRVHHRPAANLESVFRLLSEDGFAEPYSVAWIDCLARGPKLGRSVLMLGDHAPGPSPSPGIALNPGLRIPCDFPGWVLSPMAIKAFNEVFYRQNARRTKPFLATPDSFFYPLDRIGAWNRMYGRRGFIQYQCVLPDDHAFEGIRTLLEHISQAGAASFLAVLKKLGGPSEGLLAFPKPGFTLALDLPFKGSDTLRLVRDMDAVVLKAEGRINLCKDALLDPDSFRAMYPLFPRWQQIKRQLDPEGRLQSDLSRRLRMLEDR